MEVELELELGGGQEASIIWLTLEIGFVTLIAINK